MQVLTQSLPTGIDYEFPGIQIKPMTFAQVLEYLENVPKDPVEKLYFDYCLLKQDDENIDKLVITDFEYLRFFKKAITISKDQELSTTVICPKCGNKVSLRIRLSEIEFSKLDPDTKGGLKVQFNGTIRGIRLPNMEQFMKVFSKYRLYKKLSDLRIIKLISLFEDTETYHQRIEMEVINAQYKDITILAMLEDIYLDVIKPINVTCHNCVRNYKPTIEQLDSLSQDELDLLKTKAGGISVGISSLAEDFFRDILTNNQLTNEEVFIRKV